MTQPANNQGERLMRIETLLKEREKTNDAHWQTFIDAQEKLTKELVEFRKEFEAHKSDYDSMKNRGAGLLIGVTIAAGGLGAGLSSLVSWWK